MNLKKSQYLAAMGVEVWRSKDKVNQPNKTKFKDTSAKWKKLEKALMASACCELCKTRNNVVFGTGNRDADLMLIGEAPGKNEDLQGEPFVGRAGMLLTEMLRSIDLEREDVYITNVLKCRPPNNRDPLPDEVIKCAPFLGKQIELVKPKLIVAVGRIAAQTLLDSKESMGQMRGNIYKYGNNQIPLYVIYHPAYLLRSPGEKRKAYVDMLKIRKLLEKLA